MVLVSKSIGFCVHLSRHWQIFHFVGGILVSFHMEGCGFNSIFCLHGMDCLDQIGFWKEPLVGKWNFVAVVIMSLGDESFVISMESHFKSACCTVSEALCGVKKL